MKVGKIALIAAWFSLISATHAEGLESEVRQWDSNAGTSVLARCGSVQGASFDEMVVKLVTTAGKEIAVRYDQLSEKDRLWIREKYPLDAKTSAPADKNMKVIDAKERTFTILTEKDVKNASELLFPKKGDADGWRQLSAFPKTYRAAKLEMHPDYTVMAEYWFDNGLISKLPKTYWFDAVKHAFVGDRGWWEPFPEESVNDLLRLLAENNRKADGTPAFKRVAYRSGIEPTKKELESLRNSWAYAELTAELVVDRIGTKTTLLVVGAWNNDIRFMHGFNVYEGKIQRLESALANSLNVDRNEGLQIVDVFLVQEQENGFETKLLSTLRNKKGKIVIGGSFGKMVTLSPEFTAESN